MKLIHYCHIGMAKSGTSALFSYLRQHPQIDFTGIKENYNFSHHDWTLSRYCEYYQLYNVSMNFCPAQWTMDSDQITELNSVITHSSICLRNPWEYISSWYTFTKAYRKLSSEKFVDMMLETNHLDYAGIVAHWVNYCKKPLLVLYYDDLVSDQNQVCNQIANFLGLHLHQFDTSQPVNVTKEPKHQIVYRLDQIDQINKLIACTETYLGIDLTHWKQ